jgi:hypothetical protein
MLSNSRPSHLSYLLPYATRFDPASRCGILVGEGAIDLAGSVEAMLALAGDTGLEPGWHILVDLSAASYTPSLADAAKLAGLQQHTEALRGRRVAFLASTPTIQAITGVLAGIATAKGIEAKAFTESGEVERWLEGTV